MVLHMSKHPSSAKSAAGNDRLEAKSSTVHLVSAKSAADIDTACYNETLLGWHSLLYDMPLCWSFSLSGFCHHPHSVSTMRDCQALRFQTLRLVSNGLLAQLHLAHSILHNPRSSLDTGTIYQCRGWVAIAFSSVDHSGHLSSETFSASTMLQLATVVVLLIILLTYLVISLSSLLSPPYSLGLGCPYAHLLLP